MTDPSKPPPTPDLAAIRKWAGALILIKLSMLSILVALAVRQTG